jgi:DNA-directed RNA polymerase subunit RPC12/RpoP
LIREIDGISPVVLSSNIAQTLYADYGSGGEPTGWREDILSIQSRPCELYIPSSGNQSTSSRYALPQSAPQDQELLIPAPIDKGILDLSALVPSYPTSHVSLETQGEFLEASRDSSQPSQKPIETCATTSFFRNTSAKQQAKERRARYQCGICRKEFAQSQGVRRHRLEKHEPNFCPHCHTFSWGRLYQFKHHLKKEHPEVDLETAALNVAKRCHQIVPIPTTDRTCPRVPLSTTRRFRGDTWRATVLSSPVLPLQSQGPPLPCGPLTILRGS